MAQQMHHRPGGGYHHQQTPTRAPSGAHHPHPSRRGPGPMVAPAGASGGAHQMSQAQIQYQQAQARAQEMEMAKRRSKKPTDMVIPREVAELCSNSKLYADMRDVERRVDMNVTRKRLDVKDGITQASKVNKTLRIFVSNTATNQPWQAMGRLDENSFDFDTGVIPSYRMKIEGKWLDDSEEYYSSDEQSDDDIDDKGDDDDDDDDDDDEDDDEDDEEDKHDDDKDENNNSKNKNGAEQAEEYHENSEGKSKEAKKDEDTAMEGSDEADENTKKRKKRKLLPNQIPKKPRKFSTFFKRIAVELDNNNSTAMEDYADSNLIEWSRPVPQIDPRTGKPVQAHQVNEFDGFEFERKLDMSTTCTIKLWLLEVPEVYKLSDDLMKVVDAREDVRTGIVMAIWDYVLLHGLQERDDRRMITCDDNLKKIFKQERVFFPTVPDLIVSHLTPRDPLIIRYNIRVDIDSTDPSIYDILIPVDDPTRLRMAQYLESDAFDKAQRPVAAEDENVATIIAALNQSQGKREFLKGMAADPAAFINRWMGSQKRDLEMILGEKGIDSELSRRSDFYSGNAVQENIYLLLHGKDVPLGMRG